MLTNMGANIELALSGAQALNLLKEQTSQNPIELVLLDWNLTDMSGSELVAEMSQLKLQTQPKVIALTSYKDDEPQDVDPYYVGAVITQPVTPSTLFDTIHNLMNNRGGVLYSTSDDAKMEFLALQGAKVLLVEDNELNLELATELLSQQQIKVVVARDGQQALDKLKAENFDGVLMDCQMPVMDGYTATEIIRKDISTELPVIAMTANAMAGDREKAIAIGMNDHIAKPIHPDKMFATMAKWISASTLIDEESDDFFDIAAEQELGAQDSEEMPHVDMEKGLTTCGNNQTLYTKLLTRFAQQPIDFVQELHQYIEKQDREAAIRTAHTLKGNAGNIGASVLQMKAGELEADLTLNLEGNDYAIEIVADELSKVITSIEAWLDNKQEQQQTQPLVHEDNAENLALIDEKLAELKAQLADFDTAAQDTVEQLLNLMPTQTQALENALTALDEFDFDEAAEVIAELSTST